MTGAELAEKALALRPDLKVIFVSGYAGDVPVRGARLLVKPLRLDAVAALLPLRDLAQRLRHCPRKRGNDPKRGTPRYARPPILRRKPIGLIVPREW